MSDVRVLLFALLGPRTPKAIGPRVEGLFWAGSRLWTKNMEVMLENY